MGEVGNTGLWWAWLTEYPDEGSVVVAGDTEDAARKVAASLLVDDDAGPGALTVEQCDPHALKAEIFKRGEMLAKAADLLDEDVKERQIDKIALDWSETLRKDAEAERDGLQKEIEGLRAELEIRGSLLDRVREATKKGMWHDAVDRVEAIHAVPAALAEMEATVAKSIGEAVAAFEELTKERDAARAELADARVSLTAATIRERKREAEYWQKRALAVPNRAACLALAERARADAAKLTDELLRMPGMEHGPAIVEPLPDAEQDRRVKAEALAAPLHCGHPKIAERTNDDGTWCQWCSDIDSAREEVKHWGCVADTAQKERDNSKAEAAEMRAALEKAQSALADIVDSVLGSVADTAVLPTDLLEAGQEAVEAARYALDGATGWKTRCELEDLRRLKGYTDRLGYGVRFDNERLHNKAARNERGETLWFTASIPGAGRGDGTTWEEAVDALKARLIENAGPVGHYRAWAEAFALELSRRSARDPDEVVRAERYVPRPPRYDVVYAEGVKWLDGLADAPEMITPTEGAGPASGDEAAVSRSHLTAGQFADIKADDDARD